ncbi:hypothetical protein LMG24238_02989 [Paraburkholderia sediminicola]|uniref:DUF3168 domain-containing protein n=1 Tax=Paraburkholderia sediminicola TaxID=458836 RepID=A0A6J5B386_9BURK|nr:DUF3168 domain-containing protein [Paraburkholderia sediminicola]CAB3688505.1 hypothetical protein LMG24238_02989 [Paraburkholderia sediminicola]
MANSINAIVRVALDPLVDDRVFPGAAPPNTPTPYIAYQRVGGADSDTLDGISTTRNARMQVAVWSTSCEASTVLMDQAMAALCGDAIKGKPIGEPVDAYEEATKLYGSRLDISIWYST